MPFSCFMFSLNINFYFKSSSLYFHSKFCSAHFGSGVGFFVYFFPILSISLFHSCSVALLVFELWEPKKGFGCAFVCINGFPEVFFKTMNCRRAFFFQTSYYCVFKWLLLKKACTLWARDFYHCTLWKMNIEMKHM